MFFDSQDIFDCQDIFNMVQIMLQVVDILDIFNCRWWMLVNIILQVVGPAVADDAEEDEESMDWWTKYFASIDTMIEVSLIVI